MVLRRGAHHRGGAADVDLLDALVLGGAGGHGLGEGVQVDHDQVERFDPEVGELGPVGLQPQVGQDPACTLGCSVFTRPSRHSGGKPVSSSTGGVTATPASARLRAVEPVETIWTPPAAPNAVPSSASRALSYTETSARRIGLRVCSGVSLMTLLFRFGGGPVAGQLGDGLQQQGPFHNFDALVQGLHGVALVDLDRRLGEDLAGVDPGVHLEDRCPGHLHPVRQASRRRASRENSAAARDGY